LRQLFIASIAERQHNSSQHCSFSRHSVQRHRFGTFFYGLESFSHLVHTV
jgi:hypothetical protein